ncbi:translation initiation factor IF-2 [Streptomyces sp. ISL-11]|uniref:translation initiation factor IF-2 n=1 Tax=Streptomyces sp. ISL-11 TaxID=2819174 RepID=UPI001BED054D|nr:translation initiation factor IF-2 [Streptomyces sp. ISL-11]MBT2387461.1 translation initiation factor IF-2 [Streptomyces sp. ISL-11]
MNTTTATSAGTPAATAALRGLLWVAWRQHRATSWIALGVLLALCTELVWLRDAMTGYVDVHGLRTACDDPDTCMTQWAAVERFRSGYGDVLHYNGLLVEYLPLLIGVFVAGPVVARELESGTYRVAWTQSVSPAHWLLAKLALPAAAALAGVSALSALYTWTWRSVSGVDSGSLLPGQLWYDSFDALGAAPVASSLFAVALGALAGLLIRRALTAVTVTALAWTVVYWPLEALRPYLVDPVTTLSREMPGLSGDTSAWRYERGLLTGSGGRVPEPDCGVGVPPARCAAEHGGTGWYLDSHPASHLWPLQGIQAGVLLSLAAALAAGAVWWLRRAHP